MSENIPNKDVRNDEIDLMDLFNRIGRIFRRWANALGRAILTSIVFIIRSWIPLLFATVAGVIIAFLMKTSATSIYTSDMVLQNNAIETTEMISYINRLQTLDKQSLSKAISIPIETCNNINNIAAFWIIDKNKDNIPDYVDYQNTHDVYDTTNIRMLNRFDIMITINSPQELNLVRDGLLRFIENNPKFQQKNTIRLNNNQELIERLIIDIKYLDSLQKVKYFEETRKRTSQTGGQIIFMQEQNTQLLYNDIYSLYGRKQALETNRALHPTIVTLLSDFSIPTSRINGLSFYSRKVIPPIVIITLIILVLFSNRKKLFEVYKKY